MGITNFSISLLDEIMDVLKPTCICELGDQFLYTNDSNYGRYADEYYFRKESVGMYLCIDLNGNNNAWVVDFSKDISDELVNGVSVMGTFQLVTDFGFGEHCGIDGRFSWEAIYNVWRNKFLLCEIGGVVVSENPLSGFWEGHGFNYHTVEFYHELDVCSGLKLTKVGTCCAMGNCETGQNVFAVQTKISDEFPSFEVFKTLSIKQS